MTRVLLNMPSQFGGKPSGVARVAFHLIEHLLQNSEFSYVLRSPWAKAELPKPLQTSRLDVMTIRRPPFIVIDVVLQFLFMPILCRRKNIDLLVNLDSFGAPAGGRARVMVVHDLYFRALPEQIRSREIYTTDLIYRLMVPNHDEIVTVSDATKRDLAFWYPASAAKTTTIYSAPTLDADAIGTEPPEIGGRYVLAVGNATINKNFGLLAEAMALLHRSFPDVTLVHVGYDPQETIKSKLSRLGSTIRLVRIYGIDDQRLSGLYRHAACLCIASLYEGFCLPILEAQSLNCPVICSDCSATPEIAGKAALTFDPKNPQAIAEAATALLTNSDLRDTLIANGRENLRRFSWEKTARQYKDVFRSALAKHDRPKPGFAARGRP
jgi:glycosyltransferase involved in cell wall biosynthesis